MTMPRVYADFNAIEYGGEGDFSAEMALTGYGTLASLARQRIRLIEGMSLLLYEPNDIECEAVAHFDSSRKDPAGRLGAWIAKISDHRKIRDCFVERESSYAHPCFVCGNDFAAQSNTLKNLREVCINCGTSVMEPMAPPQNVT
ncbi:hypothetical protein [Collimonas arenae]|uniref:hypothetical protein n=1 Tax=Collimonas arenae TaxID=279058 RepID=UPI0007787C19|nr:hypothetical protein [Collimonas arenae]